MKTHVKIGKIAKIKFVKSVPRHSTDNLKGTALDWTFLLDDYKLGAYHHHMEGVAYNWEASEGFLVEVPNNHVPTWNFYKSFSYEDHTLLRRPHRCHYHSHLCPEKSK